MLKKIRSHHRFMLEFGLGFGFRIAKRPAFIFLLGFSATMIGIFAVLFYLIEHGANPRVAQPLDALYFSVATMTSVGFGDVAPTTSAGKVLSMAMMLLGTMLFVSFTGVVASAMLEHELEHRRGKGERE